MKTIVHNFDRDEILKNITQINNGICLELGVFKGEYSKKILEAGAKVLYMVDIWKGVEKDYEDDRNNKLHPNAYSEAMKIADLFPNKAVMIRTESKIAANLIEDESLDFMYIDANHYYESVKGDISKWYPKVKKGGIFGGHDYLKINWYEDPFFEENKKDKTIVSIDRINKIKSQDGKVKNKDERKLAIFGVNPAVDEFCNEFNYNLNITNDFFANWWVIK
jgi:hypothetical protein